MSSFFDTVFPFRDHHAIEKRFRRDGALTEKKLKQYIPTMLVNNLSVLLIITVDGLVVGNLVSSDALSAINLFYPASMLIGVVSALVGSGAGASMAMAVGRSDYDALRKMKSAVKWLMIVGALVMSVIQIPLALGVIASYGLDENMTNLTWQYAIGVMIATPFGLCSTVGTYQLQATGNMHWLMKLSIMEGVANLALDLLFVGPCQMGILGASMGTACANFLRCSATLFILIKYTDTFKTDGEKPSIKVCIEVLRCGVPEALNVLMLAFQNYFIMQVVVSAFGEEGGVVKGVCGFTFSLTNVTISGISGAMLPLIGILSGARDWDGLRILFRQCVRLLIIFTGIMTAVVVVFPEFFYTIHGVANIPDSGELCLQLFALHFAFRGCNTLFRQYYVNRKDSQYVSTITTVGNAALPLAAFLLSMVFPPFIIWLSYFVTEALMLLVNFIRYRKWIKQDQEEINQLVGVLSLSVSPEEAAEASEKIRAYADERNVDSHISYRVALCMEEMVAYARTANDEEGISIEASVRFMKESAMLTILDDGKYIALDEDRESQKLITDNYELVKRIASEVNYQHVLNMNYTVMRFKA